MSMPLDTPAAVMIRRSRCSTTRSGVGHRAELAEVVAGAPVRRRREAVEQAGGGEHERSGAHRRRERRRRRGRVRTQSSTALVVRRSGAGADAAGEHDDVRVRQLVERGVDLDAEEPVLGRARRRVVADERDVEPRDPLQHLVRPDAVERGEAGEQGDGDGLVMRRGPFGAVSVKRRR